MSFLGPDGREHVWLLAPWDPMERRAAPVADRVDAGFCQIAWARNATADRTVTALVRMDGDFVWLPEHATRYCFAHARDLVAVRQRGPYQAHQFRAGDGQYFGIWFWPDEELLHELGALERLDVTCP